MTGAILTQRAPRLLLAPNSFKGSLTPLQAARAMETGARRAVPDAECVLAPIADGGDGSVEAFLARGFTAVPIPVHGPTGEPGSSVIAVRDDLAVVELADACGLARLPGGRPDPLGSTTIGLGDAIRGALDLGVRQIVVCLGGSASTDGGAGALAALGARLLDSHERAVPPGGGSLGRIARLDLAQLDPRLTRTGLVLAVDVRSPLHGPRGAAVVFGPQKGATPRQVEELDDGLRHWGAVLHEATGTALHDREGAGAAGGTGAGLMAIGARPQPGAELIADLVGLDDEIAQADAVITGEGRLDPQTALGKGVSLVAARCAAVGVPVAAVAGEVRLPDAELRALGLSAWTDCRSRADTPTDAMVRAATLVADATEQVVRELLAVTDPARENG